MPIRREAEAAVRNALSGGLAKNEVQRRLEGRYDPVDVERALARHPDPVALRDERVLNRLLLALFTAALATKVGLLLDVARNAAVAGNLPVERASLGLVLAWFVLYLVLLALLVRASANGYPGVLGWSAASLGYSGMSLATLREATNLQLTLFVFDVAFSVCSAVLAVHLWRALYRQTP